MRTIALAGLFALWTASQAVAQAPTSQPAQTYAWPFRARPLAPASFLRLDSGLSTFAEGDGYGYAASQLASIAVAAHEHVVLFARGGWAFSRSEGGSEGTMFANVEAGATLLARPSPELRAGGHLAVVLPVGSGQGPVSGFDLDSVRPHERRARQEGVRSRMAIDAPMFLAPYFTIDAGGAIAWAYDGWTVQLDFGIETAIRASGTSPGDGAALALDGALYVAWFVLPAWSIGVELTHHQWVAGRPDVGPSATTAIAAGTRVHASLEGVVLRPGASYAHALGGALEQDDYHVLQVDLLLEL